MKITKVTSKGQVTIPVEIRTALGIDRDTHLSVVQREDEIRLRKVVQSRPLGADDPIWDLVGAGDSGRSDISTEHDRYLADAEVKRWRGSS
jgi:transcriptional pleiotropic regulator of transition state genes